MSYFASNEAWGIKMIWASKSSVSWVSLTLMSLTLRLISITKRPIIVALIKLVFVLLEIFLAKLMFVSCNIC